MVTHNGAAGGAGGSSGDRLRILVVLRAANFDRVMEGLLRCALERGHTVRVAIEQKKAGLATDAKNIFDVLEEEFSSFSSERLLPRGERWLPTATRLRYAIDLLHYFEPEFAEVESLRERARVRAPWYVRLPAFLRLVRIAPLRRGLERLLRALERRMPISDQSLAMLRRFEPDVMLVSPLVELGSSQGDHLRAADMLGVPTGLVVASWDNLTTKGVLRDVPDLTIVWNEDQVREATELHGLPAENVVATGAHSHDHWFSWRPSTPREEFAAKVGLAPERPLLLYVCSSGFIAGGDEVAFVREWARRLGTSGDPELESLGVLVRPHPQNFASWLEADVDEPDQIVIWPRAGAAPIDRQSKQDYFDSLHHASAVVGINTTALVDSAIARRPVFTLVSEHFRDTQTGTLHFSYLAREEGNGLLNVAQSWDEHFAQLGGALRSPEVHRERIEAFLRAFVRPHGLERSAAPIAAHAIEGLASTEKQPVTVGGPVRWAVGVTAGALGRVHALRERLKLAARRRARQWRRRAVRRRRRAMDRGRKRKGARRRGRGVRPKAKPPKAARAPKRPKSARGAKPPKAARAPRGDGEMASAVPGETSRSSDG